MPRCQIHPTRTCLRRAERLAVPPLPLPYRRKRRECIQPVPTRTGGTASAGKRILLVRWGHRRHHGAPDTRRKRPLPVHRTQQPGQGTVLPAHRRGKHHQGETGETPASGKTVVCLQGTRQTGTHAARADRLTECKKRDNSRRLQRHPRLLCHQADSTR